MKWYMIQILSFICINNMIKSINQPH
jgi:hypothetical protein